MCYEMHVTGCLMSVIESAHFSYTNSCTVARGCSLSMRGFEALAQSWCDRQVIQHGQHHCNVGIRREVVLLRPNQTKSADLTQSRSQALGCGLDSGRASPPDVF